MTFDPKTEGSQLQHALSYFQYQLKGVSFLPKLPQGAYAQMPYEEITEEQYQAMTAPLKGKRIDFGTVRTSEDDVVEVPDRFCDSSSCEILQVDPKLFQ